MSAKAPCSCAMPLALIKVQVFQFGPISLGQQQNSSITCIGQAVAFDVMLDSLRDCQAVTKVPGRQAKDIGQAPLTGIWICICSGNAVRLVWSWTCL